MTGPDNKQFKLDNRLYDTDYTLFYPASSIRRLKYDYDEQDFIYKNTYKQLYEEREPRTFAQVRCEDPIHYKSQY